MAGKFSLAAKLFLASSVLTTGGAGAYFGTTLGWPALVRYAENALAASQDDASLVRQTASLDADDLEAVANAWAEPAPATNPVSPSTDSSAVARSADVVLARAESAAPSDDRYSTAVEATEPVVAYPDSDESPANEPITTEEAQPKPVEQLAQVSDSKSNEEMTEDKPTAEPDLARGQEPQEAFAESNEPQPLRVSGREMPLSAQDQSNANFAQQRTATAANDRYNTPAEGTPAIVNPFSSAESSGGAASAKPDSIEPLPTQADDFAAPLQEMQQDGIGKATNSAEIPTRSARDNLRNELRGPASSRNNNADFDSLPKDEPPAANALPTDVAGEAATTEGTGRPGERALEGAQRPALEIQKFAPGEIQVGKPAKFVVQVRNVGTQAAEQVIIRDEVPQGTKLLNTSPTAETEGDQLLWRLDKLSPGEDRTVEMQLMPTTEGEIGSVATVSYSAQASVKTRCTMPQLAIRMTAPNKVMIGQEQRIKIELHNPGSGDATGVMLFENVPQSVRHAAGPALEFEIGTLKAGETRELELVLLAEKAGKTLNVLSARADGNLQVQQQIEFEIIAPGLAVDVSGPERRYLERPATYEVSVENPGTAPAHDVQIITKLPKGMRFVRANNLGEYDASTHAVYWSLAELPEGEGGTVELVAMPIETGAQTLEVESRTGEGLTDKAQRQIVVDGLAAIMFEVRDLEDPIEVGGETGYEIRIVNQGTKAATNVQVTLSLPPGIQFVSAEGETQHTAQHGRITFDPLSELAPKADTVYRVRVQGLQAGDQRVTVEVNTDEVSQPIRREESTHVFGDD